MSKSYKNQSISDISLSLARRQVSLRHGFEESTVKQADGIRDSLSSGLKNIREGAGAWWGKQPNIVKNTLIGAGIGGAAGGGASLLRKKRRKHFLRDAFTGALGGGALFGGVTAAGDYENLTDSVIGGNQAKDKELIKRFQSHVALNTPPITETILDETGSGLQAVANQVDVITPLEQLVKQAPILTGTYGASVALSAMDEAAGKLINRWGSGVNLEPAQFENLQKILRLQMDAKPGMDIGDTGIGQTLREMTGSDSAVHKLMAGDQSLMQGVRKSQKSVTGFGSTGKPSEYVPYEEVLKATRNQTGTEIVNKRDILRPWRTTPTDVSRTVEVPQTALERVLQNKTNTVARSASGASKYLNKAPRLRLKSLKTPMGITSAGLSLLAAWLSNKNRARNASNVASSADLVNPPPAP